jgi:hypothetical protein
LKDINQQACLAFRKEKSMRGKRPCSVPVGRPNSRLASLCSWIRGKKYRFLIAKIAFFICVKFKNAISMFQLSKTRPIKRKMAERITIFQSR